MDVSQIHGSGSGGRVTKNDILGYLESHRGSDADAEKRARFLGEVRLMEERWGRILEDDPAYNPNLSLEGAGFEPAFPPRAGRSTGR